MKRIIPLFAVFALFLCMFPVSACAADEYVFIYSEDDDFWVCLGETIPSGVYSLTVTAASSEPGLDFPLHSDFPFDLYFYGPDEDGVYGAFSDVSFESLGSTIEFVVFQTRGGAILYLENLSDPSYVFHLIPHFEETSLSHIVSPDTITGVLDHVVSILPVVLVVVVGFIAIRKGISFLHSFLVGS